MWEDLAEVRTLAVDPLADRATASAARCSTALVERARELGGEASCSASPSRSRSSPGTASHEIEGTPVEPDVFEQLLQSYDEGVAEFLDLERVKPNTLGNHRMLLIL